MQIMLAVVEDALIRQGMWMLDHRKQKRREKKEIMRQRRRERLSVDDDSEQAVEALRAKSGFSLGLSSSAVSLLHTTAMDGSRRR